MYAAVLQGNVTLTKSQPIKKSTATTSKRKGASKNTTDDSNTNQETIPFMSKDELKTHIRAINDELPDEILELLSENLYR